EPNNSALRLYVSGLAFKVLLAPLRSTLSASPPTCALRKELLARILLPLKRVKSVTYVLGRKCYPCIGTFNVLRRGRHGPSTASKEEVQGSGDVEERRMMPIRINMFSCP